jgi:hypothetical protein
MLTDEGFSIGRQISSASELGAVSRFRGLSWPHALRHQEWATYRERQPADQRERHEGQPYGNPVCPVS